MSIVTVAGANSNQQQPWGFSKTGVTVTAAGRPYSHWASSGTPAPGSTSGGVGGVALSSSSTQVTGQLFHTDPASGNAYLNKLNVNANTPGVLLLCDRLWHNSGLSVTSTSAQTVGSATWPARDMNGATAGAGVMLALEVTTGTGSVTETVTVSYTNSAGTSGQSATLFDPTAVSASTGMQAFLRFNLQAGDMGVQSVQTLTLGASWSVGAFSLVAYRVLAQLSITSATLGDQADAVTAAFPRLLNGVVPFFVFIPSATGVTPQLGGIYQETQG